MHEALVQTGADASPPYVIVVGSEKGGTGKSTTAVHLVVALLKLGFRVGAVDLDARQATLASFFENRSAFAATSGRRLELPVWRRIERSQAADRSAAETEERGAFERALGELADRHFVVIDTAGNDLHLSRLGHAAADTLITPLNDSFLDIAVLARIDRDKREVQAPSVYSRMVWEQNNHRIVAGRQPIDWIVVRNRLAHIEARNMREIGRLLEVLAHRIGFRLAPGIGERVVFRELFLKGLTVLDLPEEPGAESAPQGSAPQSSASQAAARQEIEALLRTVGVVGEPEPAAG